MMQAISETDFDEMLHRSEGLVLVDFWADWCGPCSSVGPVLEELAPSYEGQVDFYKVDADKNQQLMRAFGVKSIPTVLLLKPREGGADVVGQLVGSSPMPTYRALIERALNPPPTLMQRFLGLFGSRS
ncbi:MAG: thioredoxin [Myxococcales bacterium]|nr:thioredoxin [Myxococcales bacterium]